MDLTAKIVIMYAFNVLVQLIINAEDVEMVDYIIIVVLIRALINITHRMVFVLIAYHHV